MYEWLKPGVRERDIEAKVHEFMLERGCEIIYDIIVASGGNTSPYRRWATGQVDPSGRSRHRRHQRRRSVGLLHRFRPLLQVRRSVGTKMTPKEIDLYREVYDSMYAGLDKPAARQPPRRMWRRPP